MHNDFTFISVKQTPRYMRLYIITQFVRGRSMNIYTERPLLPNDYEK